MNVDEPTLAKGADRNVVVYDADAAPGVFTKRLIALMRYVHRRTGGGAPFVTTLADDESLAAYLGLGGTTLAPGDKHLVVGRGSGGEVLLGSY